MDKLITNKIISAAQHIERQLDNQLDHLDTLDSSDLASLRDKRLAELREQNKKRQEWLSKGHGVYSELPDEKAFFEVSKQSPNIVCHFYKDSTPRCLIVDHHLKILATRHIEARFCKINAEKSPFLTQRLRITVIPTIALIKNSKTKDYIVGFTDLGNTDEFSTEMMEWRIAKSGSIDYKGDLSTPPDEMKKRLKPFMSRPKKSIRSTYDSDSDLDLDN